MGSGYTDEFSYSHSASFCLFPQALARRKLGAMKTSGDRLKALLRECHLAPTDFAAHRNMSPQQVNNWFSRGVPHARIDEVAELLSVNARWLRHGIGPKYHCPTAQETAPPGQPPTLPPRQTWIDLAGSDEHDALIAFHRVKGGELVLVPDRYLRLPHLALHRLDIDPGQAVAITMPDNSMNDTLPLGSCLAVDRGLTDIYEGERYALMDNGMLRIKRIYHLPGKTLRLRSQNSDEYPDQVIGQEQLLAQRVQIVGWVFWTATLAAYRPGS